LPVAGPPSFVPRCLVSPFDSDSGAQPLGFFDRGLFINVVSSERVGLSFDRGAVPPSFPPNYRFTPPRTSQISEFAVSSI